MRSKASKIGHAVLLPGLACALLATSFAREESPRAPRQQRLEPPSYECPEAKGKLPEGARTAIDGFLGGDAAPICLGDLNANGRSEVLAVVSERTWGRGMGFYWVTRKAGIFESGADKRQAWKPVLLTSDRIENARGVIGWKAPVDKRDGIGLRFTMTAGDGGICLQIRRLDSNRYGLENPLVLVRWDPSVERYEPGRCPGGTAGKVK
ncbi:MAG TPA: hypothetical protein VFE84_10705 [Patescibacteria group bacterium]|jgi:hypothetical protein|nr:hypothetical protein [Patescibacteria group bacterium]